MFSFLFKRKPKPNTKSFIHHKDIVLEKTQNHSGTISYRPADIEQSINRVTQLPSTKIGEMVERKHDLPYQMNLCKKMMEKGDILPFCFDRCVILLRKEKRYQEELAICEYVKKWCEKAEADWDGSSAMHWKSPKLQKCIERIEKIEKLIEKHL